MGTRTTFRIAAGIVGLALTMGLAFGGGTLGGGALDGDDRGGEPMEGGLDPGVSAALAALDAPLVLRSPALPDSVTLTYLGTGGWLLRHGEAALLTAPFFSNPGLVEVGVARLATDTAAVDRHLPPVDDVPALLVGHGHYDHLMDVPWIARVRAPQARIYGSRTVVNQLHGDAGLDPARLVAVDTDPANVGTADRPGRWWTTPDGRIRFMALASEHAPHLLGVRLFHGQVDAPLAALPDRAYQWTDGPTLAWLIDLLAEDGTTVLLRLHYQDAASRPPWGFPPDDGIPVDVVILCPAGSGAAEGYPDGLLARVEPRVAILGHWEDFFRPWSAPPRPVPGTDIDAFAARLTELLPADARIIRPDPGERLRIPLRQPSMP